MDTWVDSKFSCLYNNNFDSPILVVNYKFDTEDITSGFHCLVIMLKQADGRLQNYYS